MTGLTDVQKKQMLELTNQRRQEGLNFFKNIQKIIKTKFSVFPEAANMRRVTWDEELAQVAQDYSDQCIFQLGFKI